MGGQAHVQCTIAGAPVRPDIFLRAPFLIFIFEISRCTSLWGGRIISICLDLESVRVPWWSYLVLFSFSVSLIPHGPRPRFIIPVFRNRVTPSMSSTYYMCLHNATARPRSCRPNTSARTILFRAWSFSSRDYARLVDEGSVPG